MSPSDHTPNADLDAVIDAERRLLDPAVRADRAAVDTLLHPEFTEIGASGRLWTRAAIVAEVMGDADYTAPPTSDFEASWVAADTVLLTYATTGERPARRSSVWQRIEGSWRVRFHQGTPTT